MGGTRYNATTKAKGMHGHTRAQHRLAPVALRTQLGLIRAGARITAYSPPLAQRGDLKSVQRLTTESAANAGISLPGAPRASQRVNHPGYPEHHQQEQEQS